MSCMTIFFYKQVQISRSDIRPHIKWVVSLVILHMVTSIFLQGLCGYIWVKILTLSPRRGALKGGWPMIGIAKRVQQGEGLCIKWQVDNNWNSKKNQ